MRTVLVDLDAILADFFWQILDDYHAETDYFAHPHGIDRWDAKLPNGKSLKDYFHKPGFFRKLRPIPGAADVLKALHDRGDEVLIVSSATLTNAPGEKYEWLSEHYPWLDRDRVVFCKEKYRVKGDVFIDDHADNAHRYRREHPSALVVGIEYPYNQKFATSFDLLVPSYLDLTGAWKRIGERLL